MVGILICAPVSATPAGILIVWRTSRREKHGLSGYAPAADAWPRSQVPAHCQPSLCPITREIGCRAAFNRTRSVCSVMGELLQKKRGWFPVAYAGKQHGGNRPPEGALNSIPGERTSWPLFRPPDKKHARAGFHCARRPQTGFQPRLWLPRSAATPASATRRSQSVRRPKTRRTGKKHHSRLLPGLGMRTAFPAGQADRQWPLPPHIPGTAPETPDSRKRLGNADLTHNRRYWLTHSAPLQNR